MPDLALNQFVPGQIPILVNHRFLLTVEDFSVARTRSSSVATGFAGNFAKRTGVYQYSFSFSMPPLATGSFEVSLGELGAPFTLSYRIGAQEFSLVGCEVNDDDLSVAMQAGSTTAKFRGNALSRVPV